MREPSRREELERRLEANPSSIAFAALAEEYRRAGDYTEAIRRCRSGLARHPSHLSARVTLGRALIEIGQLDEAQRELQLVLAAAQENLAAIRGLAEIHQRRGDLQEALNYFRRALDLAQHAAALNDTDDAIDQELEAEAISPPESTTPPQMDFDALLASLGHPNASPPPLVEKLFALSESADRARVEGVGAASAAPPTVPPPTPPPKRSMADPFAEIERTLRAYEAPRFSRVEAHVLEELEAWLHAIVTDRVRLPPRADA